MPVKIDYIKIKNARMSLGMSQQELSDKSKVNINIIKSLETGRTNTTYENIKNITDILNLDIDDVYNDDYRETKVITALNNKGGSGKTTLCSNLGYALSEMGYKILLIDSDMQMNLTYAFGLNRNQEKSLYHALINDDAKLEDYITKTEYHNIDIIISDFALSTIEMVLFTKIFRDSIFKLKLDPIVEKGLYDFIIIDTNPTLGLLNFNVLNASNYVIVPAESSAFGIVGLEIVVRFINDVKVANKKLELLGVVKTKVDLRESITKDANETIAELFNNKVMKTEISIDTNIKKSQWDRKPLIRNSRARKQYIQLAREVIANVKK